MTRDVRPRDRRQEVGETSGGELLIERSNSQ